MPTKTISIELDVYDLLASLRKDSRDSFSQVIRRELANVGTTGPETLRMIRETRKAYGDLSPAQITAIEEAGSDIPEIEA